MIGNYHWGEDGRNKEILLMNYLRRILPNTVSAGTGFVRVDDKLTNQIDIIDTATISMPFMAYL